MGRSLNLFPNRGQICSLSVFSFVGDRNSELKKITQTVS